MLRGIDFIGGTSVQLLCGYAEAGKTSELMRFRAEFDPEAYIPRLIHRITGRG